MRIEKLDSRMEMPQYKKLRVAAYARVSLSGDPMLKSLENQVETYTDLITSNPEWEFAGIYEDRGISGTKEMRPEFQRMLADCRAGKIDMILTKSFTRFARNTVVLLNTLRELKSLDIDVFFEKDNIHSLDESGEFLITLLAAYAQAEAQSASENQKWRIKKTFEEGRLANGGRMMGYTLKDGNLIIIPEEAETVRMIYEDYLSGMGIRAIAKKLNQLNIRTIRGKHWYPVAVRVILCNEKYTGDLLLQKVYISDYVSKKAVKNRGERTQYFVENNHEAIIPRDMFAAVQAELCRRNAERGPKRPCPPRRRALFSGLLVCGNCGKKYWRVDNYSKQPAWDCSSKITDGKTVCGNMRISERILISATMEILGVDHLDVAAMKQIKEIIVPEPNCLIYELWDGQGREVRWNANERRSTECRKNV